MNIFLYQFIHSERGAVTVDWVVLTAAIIGLSVAIMTTIGNPVLDKSTGIGATIKTRTLGYF